MCSTFNVTQDKLNLLKRGQNAWRFYLEGGWKQLIRVSAMRTSTQLKRKKSWYLCVLEYVLIMCNCLVLFFYLYTLYSTLCPCQCTVCMSTSLPIAIRYQYTLSPTSMFKPFTFPYINPLMPEKDTNTHAYSGMKFWGHFFGCSSFCVYLHLTVHLVALYEGFVIF